MRDTSDELCKKYRLSIIDKREGKGKHYAEWQAEQRGKPTWRSIIRKDVDACIDNALTYGQFINNIKSLGYEIYLNRKHITVKPPNKDRNVRLRSLTKDVSYTEEAIKQRILNNQFQLPVQKKQMIVKKFYYNGQYRKLTKRKIGGLRGLYFHYLYKMGCFPKDSPAKKKIHSLLKQDIIKMDKLSKEAILLNTNKIETIPQLTTYRSTVTNRIMHLVNDRKQLYNKFRRSDDKEVINDVKDLVTKLFED